uniref:Arginine-glutamic acid dipeptide repeats protein-like n=1 Tax=Phascolarctos cinereus TaxID=38626 RepID=A0A6P5JSA8_PHACI|nr:arginine-glutamic acid dipeptide repeats protein-like [Phascolarctos cinereus]
MGTLTPLAAEGDPQGQRTLRKNWTPGWLRQDSGRKVFPIYSEEQHSLEWEGEIDIYIPTSPPHDLPLWAWKENSGDDPSWTPSNPPSRCVKSPRLHLCKAARIFKGAGSRERLPPSGSLPSNREQQGSFSRSCSWTHQNLQPIRKLAPLEALCTPPQAASPPYCLAQSKSLPPRRLAPLRLPHPQPQPTSQGGLRTCQSPTKRPPNRLAPLEMHQRGLGPAPPPPSHSKAPLRYSPSLNDVPASVCVDSQRIPAQKKMGLSTVTFSLWASFYYSVSADKRDKMSKRI